MGQGHLCSPGDLLPRGLSTLRGTQDLVAVESTEARSRALFEGTRTFPSHYWRRAAVMKVGRTPGLLILPPESVKIPVPQNIPT